MVLLGNKTHKMKTKTIKNLIALVAVTAVSATTLMAGEMKDDTMQDGVMMKDGKMMVEKNGKAMKMHHTMTMADGTKIMSSGKVMMKDGKTMMMKEGEMMTMDGKMMMMKDGKWMEMGH